MNRYLNDPRIRKLRRPQTILVAAAVALGLFLYVTWRQGGEVSTQREGVDNGLKSARADLASLRSGSEKGQLQVELERLKFITPPSLPPLLTALEFGTALADYAAQQKLQVEAMDVASTTVDIGGAAKPVVSYSLKARGPISSLAGVLTLPDRFPTAVVETLEFTRVPETQEDWKVVVTVAVFHSGS